MQEISLAFCYKSTQQGMKGTLIWCYYTRSVRQQELCYMECNSYEYGVLFLIENKNDDIN